MNGPDNAGAKPRTDLLPPRALLETAGAMGDGANHYGERNWEDGISWGSLVGAILRHVFKWMAGEDNDSDSGRPHMAHVAATALMICELQMTGKGEDDRRLRPRRRWWHR